MNYQQEVIHELFQAVLKTRSPKIVDVQLFRVGDVCDLVLTHRSGEQVVISSADFNDQTQAFVVHHHEEEA